MELSNTDRKVETYLKNAKRRGAKIAQPTAKAEKEAIKTAAAAVSLADLAAGW